MSELYKRIEDLCKNNGISITAMCKEAGVSRGSLTDLKQGRSKKLSSDAVSKIAAFFNVSTDYILNGDNAIRVEAHNDPTKTHTYELIIFRYVFAIVVKIP